MLKDYKEDIKHVVQEYEIFHNPRYSEIKYISFLSTFFTVLLKFMNQICNQHIHQLVHFLEPQIMHAQNTGGQKSNCGQSCLNQFVVGTNQSREIYNFTM